MASLREWICQPYCPETSPEELPDRPLNEGHIAARFMEKRSDIFDHFHFTIMLYDELIPVSTCDEVCPGENGYVVTYGHAICQQGGEHYKQRRNGYVTLEMVAR